MSEVIVNLMSSGGYNNNGCVYPENELKKMVEQLNEQLKKGEKPFGELTHKNI